MIDEILSLGFDHVELSHGIKLSLLPGIMRAVDAGKVQVAGVHNFFPAPIDEVGDSPDSRPFTADLLQVRSKAIELTKSLLNRAQHWGPDISCCIWERWNPWRNARIRLICKTWRVRE